MKKINYLLVTSFLVAACAQTDSKEENRVNDSSIVAGATDNKDNEKTFSKVSVIKEKRIKESQSDLPSSDEQLTKAYVSKSDSSIHLTADINQDHRIFGYERADTTSNKLLLFSVFTSDVEKNPFNCELGAYYDTNGMDNMKLKYLQATGNFIKAVATDKLHKTRTIFFEKKWVEFEE